MPPTDPEVGGERKPLVDKSSHQHPELLVKEHPSILYDAWDTIQLGVPIFISMLSWVGVS
jgi:hypothetical protein